MRNWQAIRNRLSRRPATNRMSKPTRARTHSVPIQVRRVVVDDVIRISRAHAGRHVVQIQRLSHLPSHNMIRARGIPAHADRTHQRPTRRIQRKPTAKHIHSTNLSAHHRVVTLPIVRRVPLVGHRNIHRIAMLQAKQAPTRLRRRM